MTDLPESRDSASPFLTFEVSSHEQGLYNTHLHLKLPNLPMEELLTQLESLFQQCQEEFGVSLFSLDLGQLGAIPPIKYMRKVVELINIYFLGEGNNHLLITNVAPHWKGLIDSALNIVRAFPSELNIEYVSEENLQARVIELCGKQIES